MNGRQIYAILDKYTALAARAGEQAAFELTLENYGSEDVPSAVSRIRQQLEQLNTRTIETNPVARLRKTIERFNANVGKLDIEVNGHRVDSERAKLKIPESIRQKTFEALGSYCGRAARLAIDVRF